MIVIKSANFRDKVRVGSRYYKEMTASWPTVMIDDSYESRALLLSVRGEGGKEELAVVPFENIASMNIERIENPCRRCSGEVEPGQGKCPQCGAFVVDEPPQVPEKPTLVPPPGPPPAPEPPPAPPEPPEPEKPKKTKAEKKADKKARKRK